MMYCSTKMAYREQLLVHEDGLGLGRHVAHIGAGEEGGRCHHPERHVRHGFIVRQPWPAGTQRHTHGASLTAGCVLTPHFNGITSYLITTHSGDTWANEKGTVASMKRWWGMHG